MFSEKQVLDLMKSYVTILAVNKILLAFP